MPLSDIEAVLSQISSDEDSNGIVSDVEIDDHVQLLTTLTLTFKNLIDKQYSSNKQSQFRKFDKSDHVAQDFGAKRKL